MKWIKKGHIFKPSGKFDWSYEYAQVPTPLELEDRLRIFYTTRPKPQNGLYISHTSFIDVSKEEPSKILYIHDKPVLELGTLGQFDAYGIMPGSIIKSNNKIYMFYTGWSRRVDVPYSTSIGLAESTDCGVTFRKSFDGPVLSANSNDPYLVNGPFVIRLNSNKWVMWYASAYKWIVVDTKIDPIYKIKKAISTDGIRWESESKFCIPETIAEEAQNAPTIFGNNNRYFMIYCHRYSINFRNSTNGYRLACAYSKDLNEWETCNISFSQEATDGLWDSEMQAYPRIIQLDKRIFMFYNGNYFGRDGFGYAELDKI